MLRTSYTPDLASAPRTERYEVTALLGRGGSSLVYKAFDREMNFFVALKSLRFVDSEDVYEIKREFRSFRDVSHPNLVRLYDLHVEDGACFLTMELIEGEPFSDRHRRLLATDPAGAARDLRICLDQAAGALAALHAAGRLHRDVKPANLLVEAGPRAVLLDFGLAEEAAPKDTVLSQARLFAGTPGYLAPERLAGQTAGPPSDMFALGVALYEALAGVRPFPDGSSVRTYEAQRTPPPDPREHDPRAPADLSALALRLLAFEPDARPSAAAIGARGAGPAPSLSGEPARAGFVGRREEMAALTDAYARSREGVPVVAQVGGRSGIGKTTLIERFVDRCRAEHGALVLRSRCHHQESLRHKAFDGVADALSRHLSTLGPEALEALRPDDLGPLLTVFPVFGRVPFDFDPFAGGDEPAEPHEIVAAAAGALRDMLGRLGRARPLVIWIDDLQWSDEAGLPFLRQVVAAPETGPMLTVLSYRAEDMDESRPDGFVKAGPDVAAEIRDIAVAPLTTDEIASLVALVDPESGGRDPGWVERVAEEADGLPYFVVELAAFGREHGRAGAAPRAAEVIGRKLAELAPPQRAMLELVAVAGAPIAEPLLVRIADTLGASGREIYDLALRSLLRRRETGGRTTVETYHDRVRFAVLDLIDGARRRARHRLIAEGLAEEPDADPRALVEHFLGAGENARAALHAERAAAEAAARLGFDRAAELYGLALDLQGGEAARPDLLTAKADALANAGRSAEAADGYERAARLAAGAAPTARDAGEIVRLNAEAAKLNLYGGRLRRARELYREVFAGLGVPFPRDEREARRMSIVNRIVALLPPPPRALTRLAARRRFAASGGRPPVIPTNVVWNATAALQMQDWVMGDAVFSWFLRHSRGSRDPARQVTALSAEAVTLATLGQGWAMRRCDRLLARAGALADRADSSHARIVHETCIGFAAWSAGRWREAAARTAETIELNRRIHGRFDFQITINVITRLSALIYAGEIDEARAFQARMLEDARRRGDIYLARVLVSANGSYLNLIDDDPETALQAAEAVLAEAPEDRFTSLHWSHFYASVTTMIYQHRAEAAWALCESWWPMIRGGGFLRMGMLGSRLRDVRARAALALAARGGPEAAGLAAAARGEADAIARVRTVAGTPASAAAIRAGLAGLAGDDAERARRLAEARDGYREAGMALHAASAGHRLGDAEAAAWFASVGARDVPRLAATFVPG